MKLLKKFVMAIVCAVMLAGISLTLTACGGSSDEGAKSITNLSYNGEMISWDSVKNAKNYKITIDGSPVIVAQADKTVTYRYNSNGENFEFTIEAVIKDGSDKNPTYSLTFTNIGQVTDLKVENGALTWAPLENAEKYEIMYNGNIETNRVGTPSYNVKAGQFVYKVRGIKGAAESVDGNNPYYSIWSDAISGTVLAAPKNLKYDSETFTWEKVDGATGYKIKIGNQDFTSSTNSFGYTSGTEDFAVAIAAVGNSKNKVYDSQYCDAKQYTYISPIEGLTVEAGNLKWTASTNAVRYKIKINGVVNNDELTTNQYTALSSGKSYRIQILPIGRSENFYFSRWSEEKTINILATPTVRFSQNKVQWNAIEGAEGYTVNITKDGEVVDNKTLGKDELTYNYGFTAAGNYLVQVKANALDGTELFESKYSNSYPVKRLAAPTNPQITNDPTNQTHQLSVTFTRSVDATSFELYADDIRIATTNNGNTFSVDVTQLTDKTVESVVNFKIKAIGKIIESESAILDSTSDLEFNATRLATPRNLSISGGQLTWDSVANVSGYVISIGASRTVITTNNFSLTNTTAGTYDIYVQAMGNSENVITSALSNKISITKLATPSNLSIDNNGILTWDSVQSATAYRVKLGTETANPTGRSFDILGYRNDITAGVGTQISVYAVGNGSTLVDSNPSDTRTISKYTVPSNIGIVGDNLMWTAPSINSINCNSFKLIITPKIGSTREVALSGTSYSIDNFDTGVNKVKLIAVGGKNSQDFIIDSEESSEYTFTKLANIANFHATGNKYTWDAVDGADYYEIKLARNATWTTLHTNSYEPSFTTAGQTEISLRACSTNSNVANSTTLTKTQYVERITKLVRDDTLTNNNAFKVEVVGNQAIVTVKKQSGATGYQMSVDGLARNDYTDNGGDTITFTYTMEIPNANYSIQVKALGGEFNASEKFMLDSDNSSAVVVKYNN